jgi:hypothetical protein
MPCSTTISQMPWLAMLAVSILICFVYLLVAACSPHLPAAAAVATAAVITALVLLLVNAAVREFVTSSWFNVLLICIPFGITAHLAAWGPAVEFVLVRKPTMPAHSANPHSPVADDILTWHMYSSSGV